MENMKSMYIIAGCNGAGKTTAAYCILPEMLQCNEFVNVDEIAKGLSPFHPESVSYLAGKLMSRRVAELLERGETFAVETTLAAIVYREKVLYAQSIGYCVTLIYFWLNSPELAKERVKIRVSEGGHDVAPYLIERRYQRGLSNLFKVFLPICDNVMLFDNSDKTPHLVMGKIKDKSLEIYDQEIYDKIINSYVRA